MYVEDLNQYFWGNKEELYPDSGGCAVDQVLPYFMWGSGSQICAEVEKKRRQRPCARPLTPLLYNSDVRGEGKMKRWV